jgi:hypothetical protein
MDTIHGYMVVASGGEYSDRYHYNERFYLDRSEAVAYIESKKEAAREWNLFIEICPKYPNLGSDNRPMGEKEAVILYPPGTPNRRALIDSMVLQTQRKIQKEWFEECIKICENNFPHLIEKAKSVNFLSEECEETDLQIEEIEIPVGSRLYRLLNGAE